MFHAIGPVWETNPVWLIYVVVTLFTAFPKGFAALFTTLLVPLVLTLVGINFRGAAFAFRNFGKEKAGGQIPFMVSTFVVARMLTPCALGVSLTANATGKILWADVRAQAQPWFWIGPFTLVGEAVSMAICAYLTPIFITVRSEGNCWKTSDGRGGWPDWCLASSRPWRFPFPWSMRHSLPPVSFWWYSFTELSAANLTLKFHRNASPLPVLTPRRRA